MSDVLDSRAAGGLVIRGGALRVVGYAGGVVLGLLAVAMLTRGLGPVEFGRYVTITSLVTLVAGVTEVGMGNLATREYALLAGAERDTLMRRLLGLRLVVTTIGVLGALAFASLAGRDAAFVAGTALAGAGVLAATWQSMLATPLTVELRLGVLAALDLARNAGLVAGVVALSAAGAGLVPFLAVPLPVALVLAGATFALVRGRMPLRPEIAPAAWRRLLRLTAAFAAASSLGALYVYAAQITMSLVASDDEVGFFAASFRIFVVVGAVPGLLVASAFPLLARAARDERERLAYAVRRLFEVSLLAGVIAGLALGIGAPVAIDVAAGAEFAPAVPALRVQSVGLLATFVLAVWGFALISLGAYRALLVANAAAFATSVALTLPLAGPYGATGVAVASVAGELVLGAGYVAGLSRAGRDLRPQGRVPARAGVALVPALGVALVPGLPVLVATVLAVALFAGLAFALRTVPPELAELLPARLRRR